MEDSNKKRDYEVGKRLAKLERAVNGFQIAGQGLDGGFAPSDLRKDKTYSNTDRLTDLEDRVKNFRLFGKHGVQAAGSVKEGFAVWTEEQGGSGTPFTPGGPVNIPGCTDPTAINFDPTATIDDGSCIYGCDTPDDVSLVCDSISASRSKCGFEPFFPDDTRVFLVETKTQDIETFPDSDCPTHCQDTDVTTYDPSTCTHSCVSSGMHIFSCDVDVTFHGCGGNCVGAYAGCSYSPGTSRSGDCNVFTYTCPDIGTPRSEIGTISTCYSDEYTTEMLISNTEDALPDYDGTFSGAGCMASRTLATDESSYSISRFRYKFTFSPVGSPFTITWNEHFVPDVGSATNTPRSELQNTGDTESSVFEAHEPSSNGTITITDIVVGC